MARRTKSVQNSFSAGELAPELDYRRDTQQYSDGARSLLNNRLLVGGGAMRRPGSWWKQTLAGDARLVEFVVNESTKYILAFGAGRVDAFLPDLTASGSLTGCPWTASNFKTMDYAQSGNTAFLTASDMVPQVLTRTGASSWSRQDFPFHSDYGGRKNQPYYKLAPPAVKLAPGALTGSGVTLTLTSGWWTANHVGQRVRYHEREIEITSITSATVAVGTIIEELPKTMVLTTAAAPVGFAAGQVVEGSVTGAKGVVSGVSGTGIDVILIEKLVEFSTSDKVLGPTGNLTPSAVGTAASPASSDDWDEALFTAGNGYPSSVEIHRNRLLFGGHPLAPSALIGSQIDNLYNFDVGDGSDGDGFIETIGDAGAAQITQLHSAEQLLVLTDKGPYYVPESAANPFRPSSLAFYHFGGIWPAAKIRAGDFDGGVIMVSGSLIVKCRPTGDVTRSWAADEVSLLSSHLVKTPADACFTANFGGGPERYAAFVNDDGTLAVMQLVEEQKIRNFVPWETAGAYTSVAAVGGTIYAVAEREINGATTYLLEQFDQDVTLDAAKTYADEAALASVTTDYGRTVNVVTGDYHLGTYPLALDDPPAGPYTAGLLYERRIETLPPDIEGRQGGEAGEVMRIMEALVQVHESMRFAANGYELTAYRIGEDAGIAPPRRSGPQRFQFFGWQREPTITITQPDPLPLTVLGLKTKVAY